MSKKKVIYLSGKNQKEIFNTGPSTVDRVTHSKAVAYAKSASRCGRKVRISGQFVVLLDEQDKKKYAVL